MFFAISFIAEYQMLNSTMLHLFIIYLFFLTLGWEEEISLKNKTLNDLQNWYLIQYLCIYNSTNFTFVTFKKIVGNILESHLPVTFTLFRVLNDLFLIFNFVQS